MTYNTTPGDLHKVLTSAFADAIDKIYVIDHSPKAGIEELLPRSPRIEYMRHENLGYGSGHNVGIRKAIEEGAAYHVVLNPDVYWDDQVVKGLADYMDAHSDVGMMIPKVLNADGSLQYTCKLVPTPVDLIARRFLPGWCMKGRKRRFQLEDSGYDKVMNVPYIHGCFMMMRVEALKDVGLFDERFFMYPEDIDITRRIHARWKTLFYPGLEIYHVHAAASRTNRRMLWIHITNMVKYFNKWGWIIDPQRRKFNRRLLQTLNESKGK